VLGPLTLERAYYHCAPCQQGFCPRDRELVLEDSSLSPALTRMVAAAATEVSFEKGRALLEELAGVDLDTKQVERTAESLGAEIAQDEQDHVESLGEPPAAPTIYLGVDGTGLPMRARELEGHAGKQPDGSSKTREAKLVTVWSAEGRDKDGFPTRDPGSVTYSGAIESAASKDTDKTPSEFAQRVMREATRRSFLDAPRRVVIGDGAAWIWNLSHELFPDAIEILDLYHAKEHLADLAHTLFGPVSLCAKEWAAQRNDELDEGRFDDLLKAVDEHASSHGDARLCAAYLRQHRHRMRYPEYRAQGLCVGSGVVEAGCRVAMGDRLKRTGMHWTVRGANSITALRCCRLSGRFDRFWARRARRRAAA